MRCTKAGSQAKGKQTIINFYTDWEDMPLFLDIPMLSVLLGLSDQHIRMLCRDKQIPAFRIGSGKNAHWRFDKNKIKEWVNNQE